MDGLLFELAQVDAAGSTLALLPLSVPGLTGGPTVDAKVVVKKRGKVTRVLQNDKEIAITLEDLWVQKNPLDFLYHFHLTRLNIRYVESR